MIRVGTLFSGVGAPEIALRNLNIKHRVIFACENDKNAQLTYMENNKCETLYDNVLSFPKKVHAIDILVFGFPCQSFSYAGKMKGLNDSRGQLAIKAIDILGTVKPKFFIAENVVGLMSQDSGNTLDRLFNLMKEAGYNIKYKVLNSLDFGVPQHRRRLWFVGIRKGIDSDFKFPEGKSRKRRPLNNFLDKTVDKKFFATPAFLSKEKVQLRLKNYDKDYIPCITHTIARNGSSSEYINYIAAVNYAINQTRKPTPEECARLHGFPENFRFPSGVYITHRYHQMGNTMTTPLIEDILKNLLCK